MTVADIRKLYPKLTDEEARDVLDTARKDFGDPSFSDIATVAEQLYANKTWL